MERPILFSTPMVKAILEGHKTQTRRVVKSLVIQHDNVVYHDQCPYGKPGDLLWVRETFAKCIGRKEITPSEMPNAYEWAPDRFIVYKADSKEDTHPDHPEWGKKRWKPSIHMPKDAARIWLRITNVKVEKLQSITPEDCMAEGLKIFYCPEVKGFEFINGNITSWIKFPQDAFRHLWKSINGIESWRENPWVWVIEFERINKKKL